MSSSTLTARARPHDGAEPLGRRLVPLPQPVLLADDRVLVMLIGLPGAGKSTLARRWIASSPGTLLDSEQVAARLHPLTRVVGYERVRPVVHLLHLLRVLGGLLGTDSRVLLTDPGTSPMRRRLLTAVARAAGRRVHLRLLDVSLDVAVAGQYERERVVPQASMQRHHARWQRLCRELARTGTIAGADTVVVIPRPDAGREPAARDRSSNLFGSHSQLTGPRQGPFSMAQHLDVSRAERPARHEEQS